MSFRRTMARYQPVARRSANKTRAAALGAALLVIVAACGSGDDAASSTATAISTTATPADLTSPAEVALVSEELPDTAAARQLAWLVEAVGRLPVPLEEIEEHFAADGLALLPPDQFNAVFAQSNVVDAQVMGLVASTTTSVDAALEDRSGEHLVLSLAVDDDGKILSIQLNLMQLESRASAGLDPIALPEPTGEHPVGTDVIVVTDADRGGRSVPVQLWYPAESDEGQPAPYAPPATAAFLASTLAVPEADIEAIVTHATLAQDVATGGPFPVVLFSPGYGATRTTYSGLVTDIASHGYIVVVTDHPGDGNLVEFPDGSTVAATPPSEAEFDPAALVATRVADNEVVLAQLTRLASDAGSRFRGNLDLERLAFAGGSLGGVTAAEAMRLNPRIVAGINLDGSMFGAVAEAGLDRPFMLLGTAEADETWPAFIEHTPSAVVLAVEGMAHGNFSDWPTLTTFRPSTEPREPYQVGPLDPARSSEIQATYIVAFLDKHLRDINTGLLDGPSPSYPEVTFTRVD
jgi:dienelactone hydrolase